MKLDVKQIGRNSSWGKRQRGATLLEGVAFLGIASIVIMGAMSMVSTAHMSASTNRAMQEVEQLRNATQRLYLGQTYTDAMEWALIAAKAVPGTLTVVNGNSIKNEWGGDVWSWSDDNGDTFNISLHSVPPEVCYQMIAGATGWRDIHSDDGAVTVTSFPATVTDAQGLCADPKWNNLHFRSS